MDDASGANSTLWYKEAVKGNQQMVKKVKEYNFYDTLAQVTIQNQFIKIARGTKATITTGFGDVLDAGWNPVETLDKSFKSFKHPATKKDPKQYNGLGILLAFEE